MREFSLTQIQMTAHETKEKVVIWVVVNVVKMLWKDFTTQRSIKMIIAISIVGGVAVFLCMFFVAAVMTENGDGLVMFFSLLVFCMVTALFVLALCK